MHDKLFPIFSSVNPNARRQIKDIQVRAERLMNGRPSIEDIEEFDQYNEELRKYLFHNLTDPELIERVRQIPRIQDESRTEVVARGMLSAVLAMFAPGLVMYLHQWSRIENSKNSIREARGVYATIEFFTRNSD
jgi:hypothetical protein